MRAKTALVISAAFTVAILAGILATVSRGRRLNSWQIVNAPAKRAVILCFGDSLVSGEGAGDPAAAYPAQLATMLDARVIARGVPGETTAEGRQRARKLQGTFEGMVVVTLGGNDILQEVPLSSTLSNLNDIFREFQSRGAVVAFTGVSGPFGTRRTRAYEALCARLGVIYVPEVLKDILDDSTLKADPVHPNGKGYRLLAARVSRAIRRYISSP